LRASLPHPRALDKGEFRCTYARRVPTSDEAYDELLGLAAVELTRLIRRLSHLSSRAWSTRREPARGLLTRLVELDDRLEGTGPHVVPDLPDHGLADALAVIGGDVLEALVSRRDEVALDRVIAELRAAWAATR
jgi:hypothetical protein